MLRLESRKSAGPQGQSSLPVYRVAFRVAAFSMVKGMAVVKILLLPADFVAGAETGCSETEAVAESPARQISSLWKMAKHDVKSDKVLNSNHATRNGLVETRNQAGCFYTVGALVAERAYASSLWALEVARRIKYFVDWSQTYPEDRSKPFKPAAGTNQGRTGSKSRATDKEQRASHFVDSSVPICATWRTRSTGGC